MRLLAVALASGSRLNDIYVGLRDAWKIELFRHRASIPDAVEIDTDIGERGV